MRVGVIHYNSHAIFDRLEFFTPRCQLCKLFIGHIFTWPVLQQKFKISVNIQSMCFCHLNHCVDHCTGIRSVNGIAEQPVFTPYCEWTDRILAEIIGKAAPPVFQIGLGDMYMADVTQDDINMALVQVSKKSESVYHSVVMLLKCIFYSAEDNHLIRENPTKRIPSRGGIPEKEKPPLTDEQVEMLLDAIKGLPPYVFVMLGLYAGLRREEILGLKWDCVFLDEEVPYLSVKRAWHTEHNRPVITEQLKTKAARRDIPLPDCLTECLREAKEQSKSEFVVCNRDGEALSYTQFRRVWQYIVTRSTKERTYVRYVNGEKIKHTVTPVLGEKAKHNNTVVYTLDFQVTPHQLRHTYITNLIAASVDPKTVQYLAGHESSKITMDIYAKVKYNRPKELYAVVNGAFEQRQLELLKTE